MLLVNKVKVAIVLIVLGMASIAFAQDNSQTEGDIIIKAQKFFDVQDYELAMPLFAQLVSIHPKNPDYNYKFGVCTLFGDREDKKRPVRYLKIAAQSTCISNNKKIYYYLGLAQHQNQEFAEAMNSYNLFLASISPESIERAQVLEKVNACLFGLTLADKGNVQEIVAQSEFQKDNFHRGYRADNFDGILILKPENLLSAKEKSEGVNSFVYISEPRNILYFSAYENEEADNKDIFKVHLSQNGEWGDVEKLPSTINTLYDEDYPILTDKGTSLYFCSKGHNSLGEYDVFKSILDTSKNVFSQPENLGIGVNSPFNDILYIEDKEKKYAYFSSDRDYLSSAIGVFKIRLFENPEDENPMLAEVTSEERTSPNTLILDNASENIQETSHSEEVQLVANKIPDSDASKRAAEIISEKSRMNNLADSAFMLVATTKKYVREITNRRDRANSISQKKAEEARSLEIEFDNMMGKLPLAESQEDFDKLLAESVDLKMEICQSYERANKAKLISWVYGQQIKTKNAEINELKKRAGEIQTLSISGSAGEVVNVYTKLTNNYATADSLVDYSTEILAITQNKISYDIPEKELAFADKLKAEYRHKTILANEDYKKPEMSSDIPIVLVDNRTNNVAVNVETKNVTIEPVHIVEQITFNEPTYASADLIDEQIEISFEIDKAKLKAVPEIIEPIYYNEMIADNGFFDEDLEINFNVDRIEIKTIPENVEPIFYSELLADNILEEEKIEINLEEDAVTPIHLVEPFDLSLLAQNNQMIDEELEVNFNVDQTAQVSVADVVLPIYFEEMASTWSTEEEALEIGNIDNPINPIDLVEPVFFNEIAFNLNGMDEILEISSFEDKEIEFTIPSQINPIILDEPVLTELAFDANEVEINFNQDKIYPNNVPDIIEPIGMNGLAYNSIDPDETTLEINFDIDKSLEKIDIRRANSENAMFYLRELASNVMAIESSRSNDEILQLALTDYDELSYEELLFAASLSNSPKEKLKIFNVAFVHIDRDWRAFNNAAVTAIHIKDLDQAECFLHQASLISDSNGKIYNNMGVLSCYRQEFDKAEEFFLAANSSGVDSDYNLQVVNSMTNEKNNTIQGVSTMDTEMLGDIIDYGGSSN